MVSGLRRDYFVQVKTQCNEGKMMRVQLIKESDLTAVRALTNVIKELALDRDSFYWLFSEFFRDTSFVIYTNDQLVGFLLGFVNQAKKNQAYIYSLGVDVENRGSGIGKKLLLAFEETVCQHGVDTLYLTTTEDNQQALGFYKQMGFEEPEMFMKFGQVRLRLMKHL